MYSFISLINYIKQYSNKTVYAYYVQLGIMTVVRLSDGTNFSRSCSSKYIHRSTATAKTKKLYMYFSLYRYPVVCMSRIHVKFITALFHNHHHQVISVKMNFSSTKVQNQHKIDNHIDTSIYRITIWCSSECLDIFHGAG